MKKIAKLLVQTIIISSLSVINSEAGTGILDDLPLPVTCLPDRVDTGAVRTDHSKCHCPPAAYCNQTVTYNSKTYPKLPSFLIGCCSSPPPPPPPPPPVCISPDPNCTSRSSNQCDVLYFHDTETGCPDRTFLGPRVSRFCTNYNTTDATLTAKITNLNSCFATNCQPLRDKIRANGRNYDPMLRSAKKGGKGKGKGKGSGTSTIYQGSDQADFTAYVVCRETCFRNNFPTLLSVPEQNLNRWIKLPLTNPVPLKNGKPDYGNPDIVATKPVAGTCFKYLSIHRYSTFKQDGLCNLKDFLQNTEKSLNSSQIIFSYLDQSIESSIATGGYNGESHGDDEGYVAYIKTNGYKNTETFLNSVTTNQDTTQVPATVLNVSCGAREGFNVCLNIVSNNTACHSCLSPTTKITLSDNSVKLIKDLKVGEQIKSAYGQNATIEEVIHINWPELVLYNINDGQLKITADHPIMTKNGWRAIDYNSRKDDAGYKRYGLNTVAPLEIGDVIVTETGETPVTRIMPEAAVKNGETYNLRLKQGAKSFYANGILVKSHN